MSGAMRWVKDAAAAPGGHPTTDGSLLGGRVAYRQYRDFHRTGLEPVLMAAAVPAGPGDRVIEAGCGAGAGLLCLGQRVSGLQATGVEQDPDMAALARHNLAANRLDWPVRAERIEIFAATTQATRFDHGFANPPWHRRTASRSPEPRRDLARRGTDTVLYDWLAAFARCLRAEGTVTLALPAALHAQGSAALLEQGFGSVRLMPFWPKAGRAARLLLLQARLGGRGDSVVLPGLILHEQDGRFTAAAQAVLQDGAALVLGG